METRGWHHEYELKDVAHDMYLKFCIVHGFIICMERAAATDHQSRSITTRYF